MFRAVFVDVQENPKLESQTVLPCGTTTSLKYLAIKGYVKKNEVKSLQVHQTEVGFYLTVTLLWQKSYYLVTNTDVYTPRIFKDLHLLNEYICKYFDNFNYTVLHEQAIPTRADGSSMPESKKVFRKLAPKKVHRIGEKVKKFDPKL